MIGSSYEQDAKECVKQKYGKFSTHGKCLCKEILSPHGHGGVCCAGWIEGEAMMVYPFRVMNIGEHRIVVHRRRYRRKQIRQV